MKGEGGESSEVLMFGSNHSDCINRMDLRTSEQTIGFSELQHMLFHTYRQQGPVGKEQKNTEGIKFLGINYSVYI